MATSQIAIGGQYKDIVEGYVAVGGTYYKLSDLQLAVGGSMYPAFVPEVDFTWTIDTVPGNPFKWTLNLTVDNAYSAEIIADWTSSSLGVITPNGNPATWSSTRGPGTPRKRYGARVKITDMLQRVSYTPWVYFTVPNPAKPPTPTFSGVTTSSFTATVPAQVEADQYHWDVVSPPSGQTYTDRTLTRTGMKSGTRYGVRVRTIVNGVGGPWSDVGYVTTSSPSYTKGTYTLYPSGFRSYAPGFSSASYYWRPTSEGIRAGSSKPWAPSTGRGNQRGYIFYNYNDSKHKTLRTALNRGARITKVQLYLRRRNTAHGYGGYDPRARLQIQTHGHGSQPSGRPGIIRNFNSNHGFSRGEGKWITLPNWMGYHLVEGRQGARGLSVGGYYSPYYLFEGVGYRATGRVKITIA